MIRLNEYPHRPEYQGIGLKHCGLLFLSTPHSGSKEADWSDFLINIGDLAFGIRPEIVNILKSFNTLSAEGQEDFANMEHQPPFRAFYETEKTKVANTNRHVCSMFYLVLPLVIAGGLQVTKLLHQIVTCQSASLAGHIASPILNADHNSICKFDSTMGGFMDVADGLRYLKSVLMDQVGPVGRKSIVYSRIL